MRAGIFFPLPLPSCSFSPLNPYSLGEYLLAPIFHSHWIQDGGLIRKCGLARPKYACTAGYSWQRNPVECLLKKDDLLAALAMKYGRSLFRVFQWLLRVFRRLLPDDEFRQIGVSMTSIPACSRTQNLAFNSLLIWRFKQILVWEWFQRIAIFYRTACNICSNRLGFCVSAFYLVVHIIFMEFLHETKSKTKISHELIFVHFGFWFWLPVCTDWFKFESWEAKFSAGFFWVGSHDLGSCIQAPLVGASCQICHITITTVPHSILQLRPPLLSNQFSKIPKVCKSNHYIWNLF